MGRNIDRNLVEELKPDNCVLQSDIQKWSAQLGASRRSGSSNPARRNENRSESSPSEEYIKPAKYSRNSQDREISRVKIRPRGVISLDDMRVGGISPVVVYSVHLWAPKQLEDEE